MSPARSFTWVALAAAACGSLASAATIHSLDVSRDHDRYSLVADTFLAAPAPAIYDVLLDYDQFNRISSVYKEYGYLEPEADGTPIVFTRMEGCLLFFCKSLRRVERLETRAPSYIRTVTIPEQSDFRYATSEWVLEAVSGGTKVTYRLEMEPDFWVPPVVGPWFLKRTLMQGGARAVDRIERLANALEAGAAAGAAARGDAASAAAAAYAR